MANNPNTENKKTGTQSTERQSSQDPKGQSGSNQGSGNQQQGSAGEKIGSQSTASQGSGQGDVRFRCKDVGFENCPWEARAKNEQELMPQIEKHGREQHGIQNLDQQTRDKVKNAIRPAA